MNGEQKAVQTMQADRDSWGSEVPGQGCKIWESKAGHCVKVLSTTSKLPTWDFRSRPSALRPEPGLSWASSRGLGDGAWSLPIAGCLVCVSSWRSVEAFGLRVLQNFFEANSEFKKLP